MCCGSLASLWVCLAAVEIPIPDSKRPPDYSLPRQLARLQLKQIVESSGLAASCRRPDVFWTHNDSGDVARLFAFDKQGKPVGECRLPEIKAVDWEDMASLTLDGRPMLLIADVGDNERRRSHGVLHLVDEPLAGVSRGRLVQSVEFTYADGAHNCEAVAFDARRREVLLIEKGGFSPSRVFLLAWPAAGAKGRVVARPVATLRMSPTGMDVSPDGRRAVVATYFSAMEFVRADDETWGDAFSRGGKRVPAPARSQGEAVCYGRDGRTLYYTSEGRASPFWEVTSKPRRNPFQRPDVPAPLSDQAVAFAQSAALAGDRRDANAEAWAGLPGPQSNPLEGKWASRRRVGAETRPGEPERPNCESSRIECSSSSRAH